MRRSEVSPQKEETKKNELLSKGHNDALKLTASGKNYPFETGRFNRIFQIAEELGEGAFGQVYKAKHKLDEEFYAVKKIPIQESSQMDLNNTIEGMLKEVSTMSKFNHKRIVRYITCWIEHDITQGFPEGSDDSASETVSSLPKNNKGKVEASEGMKSETRLTSGNLGFSFEKDPQQQNLTNTSQKNEIPRQSQSDDTIPKSKDIKVCLYIQLEYCTGKTLRNLLNSPKSKQHFAKMISLFHQILEGINTFHKGKIIHRDLKPENIFLDKNHENIKIGDFGLACDLKARLIESQSQCIQQQKVNDLELTHEIGTRSYMSPEMKNKNLKSYNQQTDVFSLGIIFYEMLTNISTAHERNLLLGQLLELEKEDLQKQLKKDYPNENESILEEIAGIIVGMVHRHSDQRPVVGDIMNQVAIMKKKISDAKYRVEMATVIGYNNPETKDLPDDVKSLFVENLKGRFSICQGLKKKKGAIPSVGESIKFKYLELDNYGLPLNAIYINN